MKKKLITMVLIIGALFFLASCFKAKTYTIEFNSMGGTAVEQLVYKKDEKPNLPDSKKEGFTFTGWYLSADMGTTLGEEASFKTNLSNINIILYAMWTQITPPKFYQVEIEPNNELGRIINSYEENTLVSIPDEITNEDKVLVGFYTDHTFEGKMWDFDLDVVTSNIVLYARWGIETTNIAEYKGEATIEMRNDDNNALLIGLDPYIFNVESTKNVSNNVGLNKAGYMRIYRPSPQNGKSNVLTINVHESFIITRINISFGNEKGDAKLTLADEVITLSGYGSSLDYNELNITSFSLTNTMESGNRTDVKSIEITYIQIGPDPIRADDINRPIITLDKDDTLIELTKGDAFVSPTLYAIDVEDGPLPVMLDEKTLPDVNTAGIYYVWFSSTDLEGNESRVYITVIIREAMMVDNYYKGYNGLSGQGLKTFLNIVLNASLNIQTYAVAKEALEIADRDPFQYDHVLLMYDRDSDQGKWNHPIWEREHVWPNSKLGIERVTNEQANIGSDLHNLRAIRPHVNQTRSNYMFVRPNTASDSFGVVSEETYYPGNDDRGDVARVIFYMNTVWGLVIREDIQMLIEWHLEDPVDAFEIIRNEVIFGYQGNRNPYIDNPSFVETVYSTVKLSNGDVFTFTVEIPLTDLGFINNKNQLFA